MMAGARGHKGDGFLGALDVGVAADAPASASETMTRWLVVVLAVVVVAGALFGYDQGVISGALPGIEAAFSLSILMVQVVTSWVTLGALVGSLAGGALNDAASAPTL